MNTPSNGKVEGSSEGFTVLIVDTSDGERSHETREELASPTWPIFQIFRREHDFLADKEGDWSAMLVSVRALSILGRLKGLFRTVQSVGHVFDPRHRLWAVMWEYRIGRLKSDSWVSSIEEAERKIANATVVRVVDSKLRVREELRPIFLCR